MTFYFNTNFYRNAENSIKRFLKEKVNYLPSLKTSLGEICGKIDLRDIPSILTFYPLPQPMLLPLL